MKILKESIIQYKDYTIDYIPDYGPYSIQLDGSDILFQTEDEAKAFIDSLDESLTEEIQNSQLDEIEKFIDDIYASRKEGIATDGEYSIGNLIFKECRNKGYLDNLKELKNKIVGKELSLESLEVTIDQDLTDNRQPAENDPAELEEPFDYKAETAKAKGLKEEEIILDEGDYGQTKDALISRVNSLEPQLISKSPEKLASGYNKWKAVLHHIDGNRKNNNQDNLVLILDNSEKSPKLAEVAHGLLHMYAAMPDNQDIASALSNLDSNIRYIMLDDKINKLNFNDWWDLYGKVLINTYNKLAADPVIDQEEIAELTDESLDEKLEEKQRHDYRNELSRIAFNQAIVNDNGLFHIYNVKESDVNRIMSQIRNLDYVDWVQKTAGRYDFSKVGIPGNLQPRIYEVYGQIKN